MDYFTNNWDKYDCFGFHIVSLDHCHHTYTTNTVEHEPVI